MTPIVVATALACAGSLAVVRFPSGRRFQFVYAHATLALFLVAGVRQALVVAWIAGAVSAAREMALGPGGGALRRVRVALSAPASMSVALVVGGAVAALLGARTPLPLAGARDALACCLVLAMAYGTFVGTKELLARLLGDELDVPDEATSRDRGTMLYATTVVVGGPLQLLSHALYLLGGVVPWSLSMSWGLVFNLVVALESRAASRTYRLLRQLAANERLAALGEVTARVTHQTRHQIGLIGMSAHRLEGQLETMPEPHASVLRDELAKLSRTQDALRRIVLDSATEDESSSAGGVRALVVEQLLALAPVAERRGISVETRLDSSDERAPRDAEKVAQAVFNVVENALAVAASRVVVSTRTLGDTMEIAIEDDGPGMSDHVRARATEPFFTTKPSGMGMGLAIARAVAEEHGGTLVIESRESGGTCVVIRLGRP